MSFKYAPFTRWLIARICQAKGLPTDDQMFEVGEQLIDVFEKAASTMDMDTVFNSQQWQDIPDLHPAFQRIGVLQALEVIKLHIVLAYFTSEQDYQELLSGDSTALSNKYFEKRLTDLQRNTVKLAHACIGAAADLFRELKARREAKENELKWFAFDKVLIPE